ncbi:MAG: amidase [Gammaproteobacteria bacterium]
MSALTAAHAFTPIHQLAAAIRSGKIVPADLVELYLDRIQRLDPQLHAFVSVYADDARRAARAAGEALAAGHDLGPLHGIPIGIKDLVDIHGQITTGGSAAWNNRVSPLTATIVHKLRAAGMIVIGKTHTVEFAFGGWGTNQRMGTPWNPWDLAVQRTPGGSSSGSGVAVAAGLAPAAIGSDTGGSVRLPAAFCGVVGLKTTVGRISVHGVLPLCPTLDTIGPLTRSVEDAALLSTPCKAPTRTIRLRFANPSPIPCPACAKAWPACAWRQCRSRRAPMSSRKCWPPTMPRSPPSRRWGRRS